MSDSAVRRIGLSTLSMGGGVALAALPAAVLATAARVLTVGEAGALSVALTVGLFAGQLATAYLVEARLGSPHARVAVPGWLAVLGIAAGAALILGAVSPVVVIASIPILMVALEVGRAVGVAEHRDRREIAAAAAVGAGALGAVALSFLGTPWAFAALGVGSIAAVLVRFIGAPRTTTHATRRTRLWVTSDVALTGAVFPLLNSLILAFLGPAAAFVFASISTVSGLIAIPLNFLRVRLLKSPSVGEIGLAVAGLLVATSAILVADAIGVFDVLFGEAWTRSATLASLVIACCWRSASLLSTIPFAALRRVGAVRLVWGIRAASSGITVLIVWAAAASAQLEWIFAALLAGELVQALAYALGYRQVARSVRKAP